MAFSKILNLFAISSLAILVCSFNAAPVNALSVERDLGFMGKRAHGHDSVAKRKRTTSKRGSGRCKPKATTSSSPAASTKTSSPAGDNSQKAAPTSSQKAKSTSAPAPAQKPKTTSTFQGSGGKKVGLAYTSPGNINAFITKNTQL